MTEVFFENETFTRAATRRIPLGRILEADEVAAAIVFLASPLAAHFLEVEQHGNVDANIDELALIEIPHSNRG